MKDKGLAYRIVDKIIADLSDRWVWDDAWGSIDEYVQQEIREKWESIVKHEVESVI